MSLKTCEEGLQVGTEDILEKLRMIGEMVCMVLDVLPSDQFSFVVKVSDECNLEFTVKKV